MSIDVVERATPKVRRTFTIDPELARYLDESDNASQAANALMLDGLRDRRRREALARLVAELEAEAGWSPHPDQVLAARAVLNR